MSRYVGYLFVCILWLFVPMGAWAVSKDKNPILIICSYNPAAHQTSVTISDYMEEYGKLGGQRDIIIENMNCKSFKLFYWVRKHGRLICHKGIRCR